MLWPLKIEHVHGYMVIMKKYNFVVISRTGQIEEIININGLNVALPKPPARVYAKSKKKISEQYWEPHTLPKDLKKIQSIFQWHDTPPQFKNKWVEYIEQEFDKRDEGDWFMNNGVPTYITGTHYMYLQWTKIDVGHPDFREANRFVLYFLGKPVKLTKEVLGCVI